VAAVASEADLLAATDCAADLNMWCGAVIEFVDSQQRTEKGYNANKRLIAYTSLAKILQARSSACI
jgi:hypothetical protein